MQIPAMQGQVLTGQAVRLPEALQGKIGVLVVGFSLGSREEVTAWGRLLARDFDDSDEVLYYEMPVLASVPRLIRGWVLGKIRGSVPVEAQGRLLPIVEREEEWKRLAGFRGADDAYVLVVDQGGTVRWKSEGALSEGAYGEMKRLVEEMQGR